MRDVFFLTAGLLRAPTFLIGPPGEGIRGRLAPTLMSNTVAVIVRDSGDVALVDAGWSEDVCVDPVRTIGRMQMALVGWDARPGEAIVSQLRGFGIEPSAVTTIIATHLHLDHIGGACDFPNAEVITTDRELTAFRTFGRRAGYRDDDLARSSRLRVVSLTGRPTYGFSASHDLFGDGEVVLLDARGHTRGSIACAVRTRERNYVHIGDAVYQSWEYGLSPAGPSRTARFTSWNKKDLAETYAKLRACEADPRRPLVVPSHDVGVFERLPHRPRDESASVVRRAGAA